MMTPTELADKLRVDEEKLEEWGDMGFGPEQHDVDGQTRYRSEDVQEFIDWATCNLLTPEEVSSRLKVAEGTLQRWRSKGKGPTYVKMVGMIRYRPSDLQKYVQDNLR